MEMEHVASDQVIADLIGMGFEISDATKAVKATGPSLQEAVDFILNESLRKSNGVSSADCNRTPGKRPSSSLHSFAKLRQPSIRDVLGSGKRYKTRLSSAKLASAIPLEGSNGGTSCTSSILKRTQEADGLKGYTSPMVSNLNGTREAAVDVPCHGSDWEIGSDWEAKVTSLLHKRFGFSALKGFQKEALATCFAKKDCLVLAATGSGKSLCFQIPALLTGKVVVVISPLISLMHDQCLKLAKHGVSACFLGSGQIDRSVEEKAMNGVYDIIYVCPETVMRLIPPLQSLAESRGIALFAIDEVHCVSKWGHDFRPAYRRLSVLRENFRADTLKFLKFDIPLMALTATATVRVRDDILKSLCMSKETKIILTSFFRPNLTFSVKQSRTSSSSSYETDFRKLIEIYTKKKQPGERVEEIEKIGEDLSGNGIFNDSVLDQETVKSDEFSDDDGEVDLSSEHSSAPSKYKKLSVEFLEDEVDTVQDGDDLDVSYGEFSGQLPSMNMEGCEIPITPDSQSRLEDRFFRRQQPLEEGPSIIYVPTRKETLSIAKYLCNHGVKAAAYNAKLPKSKLRQVHQEFHENAVQVVVATIAFGMGIDKSNVRRIIHYGWPQSLEAYYQEAGRAGRDGNLADCVLYANLLKTPTLLPSKRSEEQTKLAYKMLSDCFRYGMSTSFCRVKTLVEYFGEKFSQEKCFLCDVCVKGPPSLHNLKTEAMILLQMIADSRKNSVEDMSYDGDTYGGDHQRRFFETPNFRAIVSRIREQHQEFASSDLLWWRGLARILEDKGYIREGDDKIHLQIKFPELTQAGVEFLRSEGTFNVYPEADMLLSKINPRPYSGFSEWGKGWADPEIRRQRLEKRSYRKPRRRKSVKHKPDMKTARGRLTAKLSKKR